MLRTRLSTVVASGLAAEAWLPTNKSSEPMALVAAEAELSPALGVFLKNARLMASATAERLLAIDFGPPPASDDAIYDESAPSGALTGSCGAFYFADAWLELRAFLSARPEMLTNHSWPEAVGRFLESTGYQVRRLSGPPLCRRPSQQGTIRLASGPDVPALLRAAVAARS
jgi:hypothetical protein